MSNTKRPKVKRFKTQKTYRGRGIRVAVVEKRERPKRKGIVERVMRPLKSLRSRI